MQPFISRIVAVLIAALAAHLQRNFPILILGPEEQGALVVLITYAITHLLIDRKLNPAGIVKMDKKAGDQITDAQQLTLWKRN